MRRAVTLAGRRSGSVGSQHIVRGDGRIQGGALLQVRMTLRLLLLLLLLVLLLQLLLLLLLLHLILMELQLLLEA